MALAFFGIVTLVKGHSWIHCTDYRGDVGTYEPDQCFAHPRPKNGAYPAEGAFGVDRGFDTQSGSCQSTDITNSATYPQAQYKRGQTVTLAWPSKNHVAATCTNPFIPDTSTQLFVAAQAASPTFTTEVPASFSLDPHVNGVIDFKGFQNCPNFCDNTDKSLCTGTFVVPADLADGTYSFQWNWVFNQGAPPYVSCFEATIAGDEVTTPTPPPTTPTTPVAAPVAAPTARPTTAVEADCGAMGAQCDGALFNGVGCCQSGLQCFRQSQYFSQCLPSCPEGGTESWECSETEGCKGMNDQCGGTYYDGATCCTLGSCVENSPYYSECRTDCPSGWQCDMSQSLDFSEGGVSLGVGFLFALLILAAGILGMLYGRCYERKKLTALPKEIDGAPLETFSKGRDRGSSSLVMPPANRSSSKDLFTVNKPSKPMNFPPKPPKTNAPPSRPSNQPPPPPLVKPAYTHHMV